MARPGQFDPALLPSGLFDPELNRAGLFDPDFQTTAVAAAGVVGYIEVWCPPYTSPVLRM